MTQKTAQKRLHKELHRGEATTLAVRLGEEQPISFTEASATNAVGNQGQNTIAAQLKEMIREIRRLSVELVQL